MTSKQLYELGWEAADAIETLVRDSDGVEAQYCRGMQDYLVELGIMTEADKVDYYDEIPPELLVGEYVRMVTKLASFAEAALDLPDGSELDWSVQAKALRDAAHELGRQNNYFEDPDRCSRSAWHSSDPYEVFDDSCPACGESPCMCSDPW